MTKSLQKRFISWYKQYQDSNATSLSDVYGRYSTDKEIEYEKIRTKYRNKYTNYEIRILGHNSSYYTTGAICYDDTYGYFIVETYASTYICGYENGYLYNQFTGEVFYNE